MTFYQMFRCAFFSGGQVSLLILFPWLFSLFAASPLQAAEEPSLA
jgi:hypothetical protein